MKAWMKAAAVPCVAVLTSWPLAAPAQDDHGDTRATATVVQAPSTTAGDLEEAGDRDWFRFELPGAGRLTQGKITKNVLTSTRYRDSDSDFLMKMTQICLSAPD